MRDEIFDLVSKCVYEGDSRACEELVNRVPDNGCLQVYMKEGIGIFNKKEVAYSIGCQERLVNNPRSIEISPEFNLVKLI